MRMLISAKHIRYIYISKVIVYNNAFISYALDPMLISARIEATLLYYMYFVSFTHLLIRKIIACTKSIVK